MLLNLPLRKYSERKLLRYMTLSCNLLQLTSKFPYSDVSKHKRRNVLGPNELPNSISFAVSQIFMQTLESQDSPTSRTRLCWSCLLGDYSS